MNYECHATLLEGSESEAGLESEQKEAKAMKFWITREPAALRYLCFLLFKISAHTSLA